jgi:carboxyl-terminal processing protease
MLPASNRGAGMNIGFPDVCLTPSGPVVVPVPYPNIAMNSMAASFSPVVKISGVPALNLASTIPMTSGDEGGVAHWSVKGTGRYIMGNPIVFIDRMPAINLTCPTMGNMGNNPIGAVVVPSAVNVFYTYAAPPEKEQAGGVSSEQAAALGARVSGRGEEKTLSCERLDDALVYVRVEVVTTDIASRFVAAVEGLGDGAARGLCIDVRGCPGGDLDGLVSWASLFLDAGAEIVRVEDGEGDVVIHQARHLAVFTMPLVVLVDRRTGSAAELFAACLKQNKRASILGERTYGKGSAQSFAPGGEAGFAYGTVARCEGPGGTSVEGVGVEPDIELEADAMGDAQWIAAARALLGL